MSLLRILFPAFTAGTSIGLVVTLQQAPAMNAGDKGTL